MSKFTEKSRTNDFGFARVACASPECKVGDIEFNRNQIQNLILETKKKSSEVITSPDVILFPELCITGYSCGDLFFNNNFVKQASESIRKIGNFLYNQDISSIVVVGAPILHEGLLYNCAVVMHQCDILGIVPKTYLPTYKEFYEKRQFTAAPSEKSYHYGAPFGTDILFKAYDSFFTFAIEICEDLWTVNPPSGRHALAGANLILNPSASTEVVGKAAYRKSLVLQQSARCICAYTYCSSNYTESTQDVVMGGHCIIAENGSTNSEIVPFSDEKIIYSDIDFAKLDALRRCESSYDDCKKNANLKGYETVRLTYEEAKFIDYPDGYDDYLKYAKIYPQPFVGNANEESIKEIYDIQCHGLMKRIQHTNCKSLLIGVSGGLDSTLALLVCCDAVDKLKMSRESIIAVTMPGFGTTSKTYNNSVKLINELGCTFKEISIKDGSNQMYKDIDYDPALLGITYENVQARYRTEILMNLANKHNGIVIGTGDLSEIALGWSTYNGDHMSMYAVNCSIPKTLVRTLIESRIKYSWFKVSTEVATVLNDICNTPISPELLPPDKDGNIAQKTEETIGNYYLHDFFLYHFIKYGASPTKLYTLACYAFSCNTKEAKEKVKNTLIIFLKRFISQQFKRSCIPDGPKVGTISLSPRGDWRMPSDVSYNLFVTEAENIYVGS